MNKDTGAIARFETPKDAKRAGYNLPLSSTETEALMPLTREQRKAWLKAKLSDRGATQAKRRERNRAAKAARRKNRRRK